MGSMRVFCMALVATLAPVLAAAPVPTQPESSNAKKEVECTPTEAPHQVIVAEPDFTVVVRCQPEYKFDPAVNPDDQQVYTDEKCETLKPLTTVCPDVSIAALSAKQKTAAATVSTAALNDTQTTPGATLTIKKLPADNAHTFFVQCKPTSLQTQRASEKKACKVQVTVNKAPVEGSHNQAGDGGQPGKVHVCTPAGASITLSVPAQDSSVQFQCEKEFKLHPTNSKRVFKDDCKTEEDLKDMTRTDAPAATTTTGARDQALNEAAQPVYTLRANTKPPKRKLCYLCAKQDPSVKSVLPPANYCAIYVESSARARFGAFSTPAAMLWCALAVLHFT